MSVFNNKHSLKKYKICNSPILQILPGRGRSNLLAFNQEGVVYEIDGSDFHVISEKKIFDGWLSSVEEISVKRARYFLVADTAGNLTMFNSSFKNSVWLGQKEGMVTAIECIGKERVLISYPLTKSGCRVEMISPLDRAVLTSFDLPKVDRIKDFSCPAHKWNQEKGWLMAVSSKLIMTINFNGFKMKLDSSRSEGKDYSFDEIACDAICLQVAGKEIIRSEDEKIHGHVPYAFGDDEKISTVSIKGDVQVLSEGKNLIIKEGIGKLNKHIDLGDEEFFIKHYHGPYGRIVGSTCDGHVIVIDFRMNSMKFIFD